MRAPVDVPTAGAVHATDCRTCELTTPERVTDSQLAVLFRQAQWALDAAAYAAGGAGLTRQQRTELAGNLESLATIVRASMPDTDTG